MRNMSSAPVRVLQAVGSMNVAGLETWLMHVLRGIDRDRFRIDFLVGTSEPGAYDEEIRSLGSQIYYAGRRRPLRCGAACREFLKSHEPYDAIHCHLNHLNGEVLRAAHQENIAVRVAHSHTDTKAKEAAAGLPRRCMVRLMHHWIKKHSTHGIAASTLAAVSMFGNHWQTEQKYRVLVSGFDVEPFSLEYDPERVQLELGIPSDAWVIGHVGRFEDVKNHLLLINTFAEIHRQVPDAWLLLIGDGPLRAESESLAQRLGVLNRTVFAGTRSDIPEVLCTAVDTFAFPSKYEGLGMALVEAQAAGLPCVVSDAVPREADVVPELITRRSIHESWTSALLATRGHQRGTYNALQRVMQSPFAIRNAIDVLEAIYRPDPLTTM